jgi:fructokinase
MITVAGEALIDMIVDSAGSGFRLDPRPGGGPFNVARAVARLGQPSAFLGRLSEDRFGRLLRAELDHDGVLVAVEPSADTPTTLAVVDVDRAGVPAYRFYMTGTSAATLEPGQAVLPPGTTALHVGSLGLVMEPIGTSMEQLVATSPADITVMLDPNCRPSAIAQLASLPGGTHPAGPPLGRTTPLEPSAARQAYLDRLGRVLARVDIVKTSTEDLAYLYPGRDVADAATELLGLGPACVLVTDGAAPVSAFTGGQVIRVKVPSAPIVDTVGAGDAFGGAFLTWWVGNGLGRADRADPSAVRRATAAAIQASVVTCGRRGAEPPWAYELAGHEGWDWLDKLSSPAAG